MAFVQQLECDRVEKPSIVWRLPLLLLASLLRLGDKHLLLADDVLGDFAQRHLADNSNNNSFHNSKWEPSLFTIEEEEVQTTMISVSNNKEQQPKRDASPPQDDVIAIWQKPLYWSADVVFLSSKQKRSLLNAFASCCSPYLPMGLW